MRRILSVETEKPSAENLLEWGKRFDPFILLNSNSASQQQADSYGKYDFLAAAGAIEFLPANENLFPALKKFHVEKPDWLFGYITYDVKNQLEKLSSDNNNGIEAPLYRFFIPRYILTCNDNNIQIHYDDEFDTESSAEELIQKISFSTFQSEENDLAQITARVSRENYISAFEKIKQHIQDGDIYEMNYCIEFFSAEAYIDPHSVYNSLNWLSPMPFSAFMKCDDLFLMCASPERYLAKRKNKIISQPIKGTARRGKDKVNDDQIRQSLSKDPKEQSENVMIVDMVRNDLSRTAARGTVKVEELFGVKTFKQLHQMISTIVSEMRDDVHFTDVLAKSFPMGSMTGTPKVSAMKLIEEYEKTKRGLFSGSIGYITPDGDFDFNVIIRSIIYNRRKKYLSYMAGSAITIAAKPEQEYEECMLKASAMKQVLTNAHEQV
jgi:para-aminobenzoate synthetase component I